jgi:NAD(P)-dependent dehydrogenase (short-subunit alcohol dehydrogenase family)
MTVEYDFTGQVVLVTGSGKRIGRQIALDFGRAGARVAVVDIKPSWAQETSDEISAQGGVAAAFPSDVADPAAVEALVGSVTERLGPVDILVNNAGIYPNCPVVEMDIEEWDRVFDLNVRAPFLMCRAVCGQMLARGARGCVINISSGAGSSARTGGAHYCGSKAALDMLTRVLAIELGPSGVRVVGVAPGLILDEPPLFAPGPPDNPYVTAILDAIPLQRTGVASDISRLVLWAASEEAEWVTGTVIGVDGGSQAGRTHLPLSRSARI